MSGPVVIIPPRKGMGGRAEAVHGAIFMAYMVEDRSATDVAAKVNAAHQTRESANSIVSYAHRQGWLKGTGSGPKRHTPKPPKPPRPSTARSRPPPRDEGPDLSPTNALAPDKEAVEPGHYRTRFHPANEQSRVLVNLKAGTCHFPVGDDHPGQMDLQQFCGCPAVKDKPYCRAHQRLAYKPYRPQGVREHDTTPRPTRRPA